MLSEQKHLLHKHGNLISDLCISTLTEKKDWTGHMYTINFSAGESSQTQEDQKLKQGMFYYNMTKELFPF